MMHKNCLLLVLLIALFPQVFSQTYSLSGRLFDTEVRPLSSGTVVLLNPIDSTLEFFGITNTQGQFEINNIREGRYLLQASFIGFRSLYDLVKIPGKDGSNLG